MDQARFIKDLNELKKGGYIKEKDYLTVIDGYHKYKDDLLEKESVAKAEISIPGPKPATKHIPEPKPKIVLTSEQRRERNITSLMAAGVILLLLGGLTLATSNWEVFSSFTKTLLVGGIAVLFGGLGALSERVLKIRKTAFTFIVLFALFIPITILSAGFFELFGAWLSFYGEGRYILGVLTTVLCVPIYFWFGKYFQSKLFSWFTYIASAIGFAYLLLAYGLTKQVFYFSYALGNVAFIALYHVRKTKPQDIFHKTLPVFIQSNLIFSTVLILIMFDNKLYQSFNIILTAVLYLAMRMVNERKEYELLFIGFITYGLFQLIQNSILVEYSLLTVVLIPIILLMVGKFSEKKLETYYQLANGTVSVLAFLYITIEGVLLSSGEGSVWLMLGYLVLASNFTYLSYSTTFTFFNYLAPFYLGCTFMEIYHLLGPSFHSYWGLAVGISAVFSYIIGQLLHPLQRSSFIVGSAGLLLSFLVTFTLEHYWQASIISLLITGLAIRHYKQESGEVKRLLAWLVPVFTFCTVFYLGIELFANDKISLSILSGSILLISIYLWKKADPLLSTAFIGVAIIGTIINFLVTAFNPGEPYVKVFVSLLVMIVSWLGTQHFKIKAGYAGVQIGLLFVLFFMADLAGFRLLGVNSPFVYITIAVILFISGELLKRIDNKSGFPVKVVSHLALLLIIGLTIVLNQQPLPYLLIASLYGLYLYRSNKEYECRFYLYAGLSMLAIGFHFLIEEWLQHEAQVIFSGLLVVIYLLLKEKWKKRVIWYLVPFSLFFLGEYLTALSIEPSFPLIYAAILIGFIVFYHSLKGYWKYSAAVLFVYLMIDIESLIKLNGIESIFESIIWYMAGVLITIAGIVYHKQLYTKKETYNIDLLAIFGIVYVGNGWMNSTAWLTTIGLTLLSVLFYVQAKRLPEVPVGTKIIQTIASSLGLLSFYSFINQFKIPVIIQTELYVLPWIALSYVITKRTWKLNEKVSTSIQYALLGIVAILLMVDAMLSYLVLDAIILGSLSFVSIIYGFISRQKSYFFTGLIVLLLNVLIQTRPFWGNMPWWVYLLLTGILLIGFASFNEYKKQKGIETPPIKEVILQKWKKRFGEWK